MDQREWINERQSLKEHDERKMNENKRRNSLIAWMHSLWSRGSLMGCLSRVYAESQRVMWMMHPKKTYLHDRIIKNTTPLSLQRESETRIRSTTDEEAALLTSVWGRSAVLRALTVPSRLERFVWSCAGDRGAHLWANMPPSRAWTHQDNST